MTDSLALERYAATQDPEAFAHLVQRYGQMVYATCLRTLGHAADADDAAQDTFVKLARGAGEVRSNLGAWLHRTATNTSINLMRSAGRRRTREAAVAKAEQVGDAQEELEWAEIRAAVDEALAAMPDEERTLIVQRYLVGRTHADLAAERGVSASLMSRRVSAAVEGLRERLREKGHVCAAAALSTGLAAESALAVPAGVAAALGKIAVAGMGGGVTAAAGGGSAGVAVAVVVGGVVAVAAVLCVGLLLLVLMFRAVEPRGAGDSPPPVTTGVPAGATTYEAPSTAARVVVPAAGERGAGAYGRGRIDVQARPLGTLVAAAHEVPTYRVAWEVAEAAGLYDVTVNSETWPALVRTALAREFGLVFRTEPRAIAGWALRTIPGERHRLRPPAGGRGGRSEGRTTYFMADAIPDLVSHLEFALNAPIADETGLAGRFDFELPARRKMTDAAYVRAVAASTGLWLAPVRPVMDVVVVSAADPKPAEDLTPRP